jgi:hypothetical protein
MSHSFTAAIDRRFNRRAATNISASRWLLPSITRAHSATVMCIEWVKASRAICNKCASIVVPFLSALEKINSIYLSL